jgi:hypothetical protein
MKRNEANNRANETGNDVMIATNLTAMIVTNVQQRTKRKWEIENLSKEPLIRQKGSRR